MDAMVPRPERRAQQSSDRRGHRRTGAPLEDSTTAAASWLNEGAATWDFGEDAADTRSGRMEITGSPDWRRERERDRKGIRGPGEFAAHQPWSWSFNSLLSTMFQCSLAECDAELPDIEVIPDEYPSGDLSQELGDDGVGTKTFFWAPEDFSLEVASYMVDDAPASITSESSRGGQPSQSFGPGSDEQEPASTQHMRPAAGDGVGSGPASDAQCVPYSGIRDEPSQTFGSNVFDVHVQPPDAVIVSDAVFRTQAVVATSVDDTAEEWTANWSALPPPPGAVLPPPL